MTDTAAAATGVRVFVDKQSPEAYRALNATAEAVRGVAAAAGLDRLLVELVNIRVSQINTCAYCLSLHTRAALRAGETTQRLGVLPAWRDGDVVLRPIKMRDQRAWREVNRRNRDWLRPW
ncbi:carboxymuconolactone decarboxylase family protein, partial [Streptomyces sp. NPDC003011]